MNKFEAAELEVITLEDDVVVASCDSVGCPANSCLCNQNLVPDYR